MSETTNNEFWYGFWTINAWTGRWSKAHAFPPGESKHHNYHPAPVCGVAASPESGSNGVIALVGKPDTKDVCKRCLRIVNSTKKRETDEKEIS
jgi:hypothetical protein